MKASTDSPTPALEKLYRGMTSSIRLLPDFIIIGTQRGGTTSLYSYLAEHQSIGPASIKEIHFFDKKYDRGLAWYRAHFPSLLQKYYTEHVRKLDFITGEACPYYLVHPHAAQRIATVLPSVKLIVMLRNPVDRAYSQYCHEFKLGYETLSFEDAIAHEEERIKEEKEKLLGDEHYYSYEHHHHSYLTRGIYVDQLPTWMSLFPKEQFLMIKSEDFYANPGMEFKRTLAFLNLPLSNLQEEEQQYEQLNSAVRTKLDETMRKQLVEYFRPHNARLYDYLGVDFDWDK